MEKWFKEAIEAIDNLSKEEDQLKTVIKSKNLLLRLVKEQQVRDVRDLVKRNVDVLRLSSTAKICYAKDNSGKAAENLCGLLEEMFDNKLILLTKVVQCGPTVYAWEICFSKRSANKKNINFVLEIPEADGIDADHFEEANKGKFALYREKGFSHDLITQSYDFNIIKEAFNGEVENGI